MTGYLCDSIEQMAQKAACLIRNPGEAKELGNAGHDHVRRNFLITTQLRKELTLVARLLGYVLPYDQE